MPIDAAVAKLGGQPAWLDEPFWPVSASSGVPMTFIGQLPLPGPDRRMSYLFVAQDDDTALTFDPEAGENALLVQPGGRVPSFLMGLPAGTGPTLWRRGAEWTQRVPVELYVDAHPASEATESAVNREAAMQAAERDGLFLDGDGDQNWVDCRIRRWSTALLAAINDEDRRLLAVLLRGRAEWLVIMGVGWVGCPTGRGSMIAG